MWFKLMISHKQKCWYHGKLSNDLPYEPLYLNMALDSWFMRDYECESHWYLFSPYIEPMCKPKIEVHLLGGVLKMLF